MYIPWGIRTLLYCCACFLIAPPLFLGFSHSSVGKESTCNAGDPSLIPELGRSAGEGIGYLLPYSWTSLVAQLVKKSACNAGDLGSVPGLGRSPRGGNGNPLQCSCLENPLEQRSLACCTPWGHEELDADWETKQSTAQQAYPVNNYTLACNNSCIVHL